MPVSEVFNMDCMEYMAAIPDNFFDLAIIDPPYGINAEQGTNRASRAQFANKQYGWDNAAPKEDYFIELFRVGTNQIIWGANHFIENIPNANSKHWLIWDKQNPDRCFADAEMAWCSKMDNTRIIDLRRVQELNRQNNGKIHPTQKPTELYKWILRKYATCHNCDNEGYIWEKYHNIKTREECEDCKIAKKGMPKIFDSHMGSQSSRLAAWEMGFDYYGCELDKEYFDAGCKRFEDFKLQLKLL